MILSADDGRIDIHAVGRTPTWTQLQQTAEVGATTIQLLVDNANWQVGDEVVVASSDYASDGHPSNERRRITAISGRTVTLSDPLKYWHFGAPQIKKRFGYPIDLRAEVGVLASNVLIEGDMSSASAAVPDESQWYASSQLRYGAHMIQLDRSINRIKGIAVRHMGQGGRLAR